jgi:hypothetical protein
VFHSKRAHGRNGRKAQKAGALKGETPSRGKLESSLKRREAQSVKVEVEKPYEGDPKRETLFGGLFRRESLEGPKP